MVRTHELKKHFRDGKTGIKKAVDGISFEAKPGRIFGLLGVNGAGKTTTLRMLSTVIRPTEGKAEVAGFDVVQDSEKVRANIGFMSNSTALYGRLTAREVIAYFGGLYGLSGSELKQRLDYVTDKLQLGEFADRLCDKLSTGQKQRVNIARTILHDPPVLFFDEPTAGLDVVMSQSVMEFIEEARNQGKTVIFSTHIMSEVERLCDDVAVIHDGVIRGEGSVQDLKDQTGEITLEKAFLKLVEFRSEVLI
ncbi:MAG TPA: ATP-binding cassette domain-containing protein [Fimbriimonas sp.]|nr:ATP-binding cassette domain-containing protein [Fimbriimonas sp.]